jgi:hypothetical protein
VLAERVVEHAVVVEADERVGGLQLGHEALVILTSTGRTDGRIGRDFNHRRHGVQQPITVSLKIGWRKAPRGAGRDLHGLGEELQLCEVVLQG